MGQNKYVEGAVVRRLLLYNNCSRSSQPLVSSGKDRPLPCWCGLFFFHVGQERQYEHAEQKHQSNGILHLHFCHPLS